MTGEEEGAPIVAAWLQRGDGVGRLPVSGNENKLRFYDPLT